MQDITVEQVQFMRDLLFAGKYDAYTFLVSRIPSLHQRYLTYCQQQVKDVCSDICLANKYVVIKTYHLNPNISDTQLYLFRQPKFFGKGEFLGATSLYIDIEFNIDLFPEFFDQVFTDKLVLILSLTKYPQYIDRMKYTFTTFTSEELHKIYNLGVNPQFGIDNSFDISLCDSLSTYYEIATQYGAKLTDINISNFLRTIPIYITNKKSLGSALRVLVLHGLNPFERAALFTDINLGELVFDHIHPSRFTGIYGLVYYHDLCNYYIRERNNWSISNRVFETRLEKEIINYLLSSNIITLYLHYLPIELLEIIIAHFLYFDPNYLGPRDDLLSDSADDEFEY